MQLENLIDFIIYEDEDIKAENAIFKAYLYAFFRYKLYIWKLYNSGKICKLQAVKRMNVAWQKLKLIQTDSELYVNLYNYDAKSQFYLVNPIFFCLYLEAQVGLWN